MLRAQAHSLSGHIRSIQAASAGTESCNALPQGSAQADRLCGDVTRLVAACAAASAALRTHAAALLRRAVLTDCHQPQAGLALPCSAPQLGPCRVGPQTFREPGCGSQGVEAGATDGPSLRLLAASLGNICKGGGASLRLHVPALAQAPAAVAHRALAAVLQVNAAPPAPARASLQASARLCLSGNTEQQQQQQMLAVAARCMQSCTMVRRSVVQSSEYHSHGALVCAHSQAGVHKFMRTSNCMQMSPQGPKVGLGCAGCFWPALASRPGSCAGPESSSSQRQFLWWLHRRQLHHSCGAWQQRHAGHCAPASASRVGCYERSMHTSASSLNHSRIAVPVASLQVVSLSSSLMCPCILGG